MTGDRSCLQSEVINDWISDWNSTSKPCAVQQRIRNIQTLTDFPHAHVSIFFITFSRLRWFSLECNVAPLEYSASHLSIFQNTRLIKPNHRQYTEHYFACAPRIVIDTWTHIKGSGVVSVRARAYSSSLFKLFPLFFSIACPNYGITFGSC